jgi:hypothetical protein
MQEHDLHSSKVSSHHSESALARCQTELEEERLYPISLQDELEMQHDSHKEPESVLGLGFVAQESDSLKYFVEFECQIS